MIVLHDARIDEPTPGAVERLVPIKVNGYCSIEGGLLDGEPVIVKRYRGDDTTLVRREADAIRFVHDLVADEPGWMASRLLRLDTAANELVMERLPGRHLSDLVKRLPDDRLLRERVVSAMERLGALLARIRTETRRSGDQPSSFLLEYLAYVSARLEALPGLGPALFRGAGVSAVLLWQELLKSGDPPSWSHGDLVFRNLLLSGGRLGIIDLANTNGRAHLLNDVYGLEVALQGTVPSASLRSELRSAFWRGLGRLDFPPAVHRFYWELNRRRWLSLLLSSRSPAAVARGLWSLHRVARVEPGQTSWPAAVER